MTASSNTMEPPINPPAFITFLQNLAESVAKLAEDEEIGEVKHRIAQVDENLTCLEIKFIGEDEGPVYQIITRKNYFGENMVRLYNTETDEYHMVSAKPTTILQIISY